MEKLGQNRQRYSETDFDRKNAQQAKLNEIN